LKNRLRLAELINNLLEFTQIRLGGGLSINKATLDLTIQSEKIIQELQLAYPEANMIIQSPGPVKGQWDRIRLDQFMTNLITNAIRYGTPGGPVKIKIYAEANKAFFEVHNEGPEIPEKIQDKIFTGSSQKVTKIPQMMKVMVSAYIL